MLRNMSNTDRTPEGQLVRAALERSGRSIRSVAQDVPISDTRLRQWMTGVDAKGEEVPFPARRLARVAQILGIGPTSLSMSGRPDASKILERMIEEAEVHATAATLTPEEIARQLQGMAKRIGELERSNEELRDEIDELRSESD